MSSPERTSTAPRSPRRNSACPLPSAPANTPRSRVSPCNVVGCIDTGRGGRLRASEQRRRRDRGRIRLGQRRRGHRCRPRTEPAPSPIRDHVAQQQHGRERRGAAGDAPAPVCFCLRVTGLQLESPPFAAAALPVGLANYPMTIGPERCRGIAVAPAGRRLGRPVAAGTRPSRRGPLPPPGTRIPAWPTRPLTPFPPSSARSRAASAFPGPRSASSCW